MTLSTTYRRLPVAPPNDGGPFDPDKDILIRQSTIGQLQMCAKRVELEDKPGYLGMVSEALAFGQCMHFMAYTYLSTGQHVIDDMSWVNEILVEQYDWSLAQVPKPHEFFQQLITAYKEWLVVVVPTINVDTIVGLEEVVYLYLGEGREKRIWLRGTPDLTQTSMLTDWKTGKSRWSQQKVDVSLQATLYLSLVKQQYGVSPKHFRFWTYPRPKGGWVAYDTKRTEKQLNAGLLTAYDYGRQMEAGVFPATPVPETFQKKRGWYCAPKWCSAWNICPAKFLGDGVDEQLVAIRSWN